MDSTCKSLAVRPGLTVPMSHALTIYTIMTRHSTYSWEFITTLYYEWSIIRGRRSHNWTIWVRSDTSIYLCLTPAWSSELIRRLVDLCYYTLVRSCYCNT